MTGTGRSLLAAWLAAVLAAPVGAAAGGLLCAVIVALVTGGFAPSGPDSPGSLVRLGLSLGTWLLAVTVPAALVAVHILARRLPKARYAMLLGWTGFLVAGVLPYLFVPGYDALPLGLVSGMASAWAFAQAGGRVHDAIPGDAAR